ncbi:MAG: hypothetical protein NTX88_08845 [Candidatus Atribacteria bacterium]|nr:hypothetical protein [Candidatus Atribacteria bacterium]
MSGKIIILWLFFLMSIVCVLSPTGRALTGTFHYAILSRNEEVGETVYEIKQDNSQIRIVSFFRMRKEEKWENDGELVLESTTGSPIFSRKWISLPQGNMILETSYTKEGMEIRMKAPEGEKRALLPESGPVFDMEEVGFLPSLLGLDRFTHQILRVLIPVSGMVWQGIIWKISETDQTVDFGYTLAGEILYLKYQKAAPQELVELHAPSRGYTLKLKSSEK